MSPRIIGANLIVSIKSFYREKTAVFFRVAFPVLLILVFGTIFMNQDNVRYDFYMQDLDQTDSSAELIKNLGSNENFKIIMVDPNINAAQHARKSKINLIVVIPKGYESSLIQRMTLEDLSVSAAITYIYDPSSTSVETKMEILNAVFAEINQSMSGKPTFISRP